VRKRQKEGMAPFGGLKLDRRKNQPPRALSGQDLRLVIMFRLAVQTGVENRDFMNTTTTSTSQSETRMGRHPLIWYFALA
jgi:hypothetical protein